MKIEKWDNSLAVRLPASIVEELRLSAGDEVELILKPASQALGLSAESRDEILEEIRKQRKQLPPDFKFNREEAHQRGKLDSIVDEPGAAAD